MKNIACRVAFIGCGSGCTGVFVSLSASDSELLELGAAVAESVASPAPDSSVASCSSSSLLLSSAD